jgi:ABC-type sugar transport system substrate-binding protein/anti-anti-sigma regulatory factor
MASTISSRSQQSDEPSVSARLRIGCVHRIRHFPYWAILAHGISARAAELGIELCLPVEDADADWQGPASEVVLQRPSVVILPHSVTEAFPDVVRPFAAAGIPIVGVEMEPSAQYVSVVRADEAQGARLVVTHLFERIGGQGHVANIFAGTHTHRQTTFHALLQRYPVITLAYEGEGQWNRAGGARAMHAALDACPTICGVFAHNDHMAVGAADVIAERGLGEQIVVVGFDADPEGLIAIRERRLAATAYRGIYRIGRTAVDTALRVALGEPVEPEIRVLIKLITAENLVDATLDTTYLLPGLLNDLIASNRVQRQLQATTIAAQRSLIQELSTPILPLSDTILIMPLIGTIDNGRAQQITEAMLGAIAQHGARYLIVDISGIAIVDTAIAHHLIQAARAVQLLGARVLLVGISPEVAQTLVGLGIDFRALSTYATLQDGFAYAQQQQVRIARANG